jgi:hypothetical protein
MYQDVSRCIKMYQDVKVTQIDNMKRAPVALRCLEATRIPGERECSGATRCAKTKTQRMPEFFEFFEFFEFSLDSLDSFVFSRIFT